MSISHRQRIETCLAGEKPDRAPVALWRHFPVDDQTPEGLAAAHLAFQGLYDFDFMKVTPVSSYSVSDWGVSDEWRGNTEGTREYSQRGIHQPEDWAKLETLDPNKGQLAKELDALRIISKVLGEGVPVIETVFSPLGQAKKMLGEGELLVHMRRHPEALHAGLRTITASTLRFIQAAAKYGIAGIFYAVQHAQYGLLSADEFRIFGRYYDLQVLEAAQDLWFNMLHLHGKEVMFSEVSEYPVVAINWHDQETPPSLNEALTQFPGVVCGGLKQWETMVLGTPAQVKKEARNAIEETDGKRFILGTGCVTPITAPHGNLLAARQSVEGAS